LADNQPIVKFVRCRLSAER